MPDTNKMILLVITVVGSTVGALGWFTSTVEGALDKHGKHPHEPTAERLAALEKADSAQNTKIAKLGGVPGRVEYLSARIDLLVESELDHARYSPVHKRRMDRAAAKVRSAAKARGESDPLAGMGGL